MALRKFWLVMPIPGASNNDLEVELRAERPSRTVRGGNNGIRLDRGQIPERFFTSENEAVQESERLARLNPMVPYAVLGIVNVRETATPTVIAKRFTDDGELVIV